MRVLVTGACGFVGPYLVQELTSRSHEVIASVLSPEKADEASCRGTPLRELVSQVVPLDITDGKACGELIAELKPDAVCHLAGLAFAPDAAARFDLALSINVLGVFHVCQSLTDHCADSKFLLASSGEVYGGVALEELPITEQQAPAPMNPYSVSKLQAEEVVHFFERRASLSSVIARPFNHIGPGQSEKFVTSNFAAQLARIALGKQDPVLKVGNLEAKRDFTDVRDIVRGYALMLEAGQGTYNLASGSARSIQQLLDTLIEVSGVEVAIEQDPTRMRPSEVPEIRGSFDLAKNELEWEPALDVKESLKDVYDFWYEKLK